MFVRNSFARSIASAGKSLEDRTTEDSAAASSCRGKVISLFTNFKWIPDVATDQFVEPESDALAHASGNGICLDADRTFDRIFGSKKTGAE
jgi:hypothetical protein